MRQIVEIPTHEIKPQLLQREPSEKGLTELVKSISAVGILEPLLVMKTPSGYVLQAGLRRLTAAKRAGLPTVPCLVLDLEQAQGFSVTLHENLYRENLNPVDEAQIYLVLRDQHKYKVEEIAQIVSQSPGYVSQRLQIQMWPDNLMSALRSEQITFSVARELAMIHDSKHRNWLLHYAIEGGVNYRTARRWRIEWQSQPKEPERTLDYTQPPPEPEPPPKVYIPCFWCERETPVDQIITARFCPECYGALKLNRDKTA